MERNAVGLRVDAGIAMALNSLPIDLPVIVDGAIEELKYEVGRDPDLDKVEDLIEEMENADVIGAIYEALSHIPEPVTFQDAAWSMGISADTLEELVENDELQVEKFDEDGSPMFTDLEMDACISEKGEC